MNPQPSVRIPTPRENRCQVLVIGAGLAGVSVALLLKKRLPDTRIVVVEERQELGGSGHTQVLTGPGAVFYQMAMHAAGLLAREHLPRYGEHFWFSGSQADSFRQLTEIAADEFASHPGHHVDTCALRAKLLASAETLGVQFIYGTRVSHVRAQWPASSAYLKDSNGTRAMQTRWIIDASGASSLLARQFELRQNLPTPECTIAVANWTGTLDFDELSDVPVGADPGQADLRSFSRSREFATHQFLGEDWRVSLFPNVRGGNTLQLEMDRKRFDEYRGVQGARESYSRFLREKPGLRQLLRPAQLDGSSFKLHHQEDWATKQHGDRGWFLVGDAGGCLSTLFTPPLDSLARSVWNAAQIISLDLGPRGYEGKVVELLRLYNLREQQHDQSDEALLKSESRALAGDAALFAVAYSLRRGLLSLELARLGRKLDYLSTLSWHSIWQQGLRGVVFKRLRRLARTRLATGHYGEDNHDWQLELGPGEGTLRPFLAAGVRWLGLEAANLRVAMSPVPGDLKVPHAPEIARRIALLPRVGASTPCPGQDSE